ncbi:MAG TPA: hypothetical protein VLK35_06950 [Methylomirabilota bacterium]|nr:hypothetical protein [Methylomirabilota bacterium]
MRVWRERPEGTVIEDRTYPVRPASPAVNIGIIMGEVIDLKVTERVERSSDRVVSPARLTGTLRLTNTAVNRSVRLVEARLLFIDAEGQPIKLTAGRTDLPVKLSTYGREWLDPGQDTTQSLDMEFPGEALKARLLRDIRVELSYVPSPFRREAVSFAVSIGVGQVT